ncbi:MAG: ribosomal protein [Pseudomonadota bacterium]|jgi:small subunit ribosomal protein S8
MSGKFLLGNVLSSLCNHNVSSRDYLVTEYSSFICGVLQVMISNGYISSFEIVNNNNIPYIKIFPAVYNGKKTINKIILYSTPGSRVYKTVDEISHIMSRNKYHTYIFSTSLGVMSGFEAVKKNIGGEFLCEVL